MWGSSLAVTLARFRVQRLRHHYDITVLWSLLIFTATSEYHKHQDDHHNNDCDDNSDGELGRRGFVPLLDEASIRIRAVILVLSATAVRLEVTHQCRGDTRAIHLTFELLARAWSAAFLIRAILALWDAIAAFLERHTRLIPTFELTGAAGRTVVLVTGVLAIIVAVAVPYLRDTFLAATALAGELVCGTCGRLGTRLLIGRQGQIHGARAAGIAIGFHVTQVSTASIVVAAGMAVMIIQRKPVHGDDVPHALHPTLDMHSVLPSEDIDSLDVLAINPIQVRPKHSQTRGLDFAGYQHLTVPPIKVCVFDTFQTIVSPEDLFCARIHSQLARIIQAIVDQCHSGCPVHSRSFDGGWLHQVNPKQESAIQEGSTCYTNHNISVLLICI